MYYTCTQYREACQSSVYHLGYEDMKARNGAWGTEYQQQLPQATVHRNGVGVRVWAAAVTCITL